jgi:hypothetical protein
MPNNTNDIILRLRLEMKDLQKQQKIFGAELSKMKKQVESLTAQFKNSSKEQTKAIEETTKAVKKSADEFKNTEKRKQDEFKKTNKEVDAQKKKLQELGKFAQSKTGRFITGFAAGAGIGGLGKGITAQGAGSFIGRGISRGIGGVANFAMQGFSNAYQSYLQYGQAVGGLVGLGTPGQMRAGKRAAGGAGGARLGYSMIETAQQAAGVGRATGNIGAVYKAQQAARATGMDVGEVGGYMGMIRQAGYGFGGMAQGPGGQQQVGQTGPKQLEKIIAAGMASGIEKARLPEFLQGVAGITQAAGARTAGAVNVQGIAAFQAMLGKSGKSGFQGARGAAVTQQLMQATVTPGGGEAGQSMMLQALGFGKPGGQTSYYDALKRQQQGMQRPENVMAMFKEVYSQLGATGKGGSAKVQQEANIALSEMSGLSLDQVEKLGDIFNSGQNTEKQLEEMKKEIEKAEPIDKQALKEMKKGFGGTVQYLAGISDMTVAIGSKVAPFMMEMAKLQLKALNWLANQLPKVIDWLKELYMGARTLFAWFSGGQVKGSKFEDVQASAIEQSELLKRVYGEKGQRTALGELAYQLKATEMYKKQAAEFGKAPIGDLTDVSNVARPATSFLSAAGELAQGKIGYSEAFMKTIKGTLVQQQIDVDTAMKSVVGKKLAERGEAESRAAVTIAAKRVSAEGGIDITTQAELLKETKAQNETLQAIDKELKKTTAKVEKRTGRTSSVIPHGTK